jgi:hypothetical protein
MGHHYRGSRRMLPLARCLLLLCLILGMLLLPRSVASQVEIASLVITDLKADDFPQISLQVLASDGSGHTLENLPIDSIAIREENEIQKIISIDPVEIGVRIAIVLDPGDGSFRTGVTLTQLHQQVLKDLEIFTRGRPWMLAGGDEVILLAQEGENSRIIAPLTSDPEVLMQAIEAYVPPVGAAVQSPEFGDFTRAALMTALKELKLARPGFVDRKEAILLYTPGMRADLADVAEEAISLGIPIHIVLTRNAALEYWAEALRPLAEVTGGQFLETYENDDPEPLFEHLASQRRQHMITYRTALMTSGKRTVVLEATGGVSASTQYSIEIQPPQVEIIAPSEDLITREATQETVAPADADPAFVFVVAQVNWPDGKPRKVQGARLIVDGIAVSQGAVVDDRAQIAWDIRSYQSEGWTPTSLRVEVVDEYGLMGQSPPITVAIRYMPWPEEPGVDLPKDILLYVAIGIALVSLGLAIYLYLNRTRVGSALQDARDGLVDFVERVTGRRTAMQARAYLVPLEGFDEPPTKSYELYGTTAIGRSRRYADLLFHRMEEDSPISRLHCTILDEDDHFSIRDEDSSNGTFVNTERLPSLQPVMLHDGDMIDIAPLERGGIRLMFQLARLDGKLPVTEDQFNVTRPRNLTPPQQDE